MKLTVLTDNNTYIDQYYLGEPGVSYYIEDGNTSVLFDTGYSDVYLRNACAMGIDLSRVETVVLSHGHNDHTGGLVYFPKEQRPRLLAHPNIFEQKRAQGLSVCSPCSLEQANQQFSVTLSRTPVKISEHLTFLGEIPRVTDFESKNPVGEALRDGTWHADLLPDDTALMYTCDKGFYIITGCSHSGICNIIEYAKQICGGRLCGVIGGFHLFGKSLQLEKTISYFQQQPKPLSLYPCHCTDFAARAELNSKLPIQEVGVGLQLIW